MRHRAHQEAVSFAVLLTALLLGALPLAAPAAAADGGPVPGTFTGGALVKTGWWGQSNQQAPETGLLAPPSVPSVAAPKGTLPVAAIAGQAERITALEFSLTGETDSQVRSVKLVLQESGEASANPNSSAGTVTACPLTEAFWVGVENGPWDTAPSYDCTLGSAAGKRNDEGVWTFDLTSLASQWLASDRKFAPAVVLVSAPPGPAASAPPQPASTFQVAFDGVKGVGLVAKTKAPPKDDDDDAGDPDPATDQDDSGGGLGGGGGGFGAVVDAAEDLLDAVPAADVPASTPTDEPAAETVSAAVTPVAAPVLPWHGGIGAKSLLGIPVLLLAYLVMLAMGPGGQPVVGGGRRGVSRALDRMKAEGAARLPGRKSS